MISNTLLRGIFHRNLSRKEISRLFRNPTILRFIPYQMLQTFRQVNEYEDWLELGRTTAPPHFVKQMIVRRFAKRFRLQAFVETGTYRGDMIAAVEDIFDQVYSIELGQELWKTARDRFLGKKHITILQGDSQHLLPQVLTALTVPCLFWLDAHWSAGVTAKGLRNTPVMEELRHICRRQVEGDVILIDDARHFTGRNDYPSVDEITSFLKSLGYRRTIEVMDDIIRIYRQQNGK